MKVLVDMNLSPRWIDALAQSGIASSHWSSVGRHDAPDREIMAYARAQDCVVLTHDLDFGAILAATQVSKPSVVQVRADDTRPEAIGQAVVDALREMAAELRDGALVVVEPGRARLRVLPLPRS